MFRIHKALQLEVFDQCNQKLSKGRLKVPQTDFLYLLLPWTSYKQKWSLYSNYMAYV